MLAALKPFRMAGVQYGPRVDLAQFHAAVQAATAAREAVLAQTLEPKEAAWRVADADNRLAQAHEALRVAGLPRLQTIPPEAWFAQNAKLRRQLLDGRFVLQRRGNDFVGHGLGLIE